MLAQPLFIAAWPSSEEDTGTGLASSPRCLLLHRDWLHRQSDPLLVCRPLGCIVVAGLSVNQPLHRAACQTPETLARGARDPRRDAPAAGHPSTQRSGPTPKARTRQVPCDHGDVAAAGLPG